MSANFYQSESHSASKKLLSLLESHLCDEQLDHVNNAIALAYSAHLRQQRDSGDPYFLHPVRVAIKLAIREPRDSDAIVAALLHDIVEDTEVKLDDICMHFGSRVAKFVDALTKRECEIQTFFNLLETGQNHPVVVLIKLLDVIDNLETIEHMQRKNGLSQSGRQRKFALKAICFYARIARVFGFPDIEDEIRAGALPYITNKSVTHNDNVRPCRYHQSPRVVRSRGWCWVGRCRHHPVYTLPVRRHTT